MSYNNNTVFVLRHFMMKQHKKKEENFEEKRYSYCTETMASEKMKRFTFRVHMNFVDTT